MQLLGQFVEFCGMTKWEATWQPRFMRLCTGGKQLSVEVESTI